MMKKSIIITSLSLMFLILLTANVWATDYATETIMKPQIIIEGEDKVKPEETKTVRVKVSSGNDKVAIGVVSGKIKINSNITQINIISKNEWEIEYNQETKEFLCINAQGIKNGEIFDIEYKLNNQEGVAKINISDIEISTINNETNEYGDIKLEDISKEIIVEKEPVKITLTGIKIAKEPNKTTYNEGEKFDKTGMVVVAVYSDGTTKTITEYTYLPTKELKASDTKIIITYEEDNIKRSIEQEITVVKEDKKEEEKPNKESGKNDNTMSDKEIPSAGNKIFGKIIVSMMVIIAIILYFKYRKYKNI